MQIATWFYLQGRTQAEIARDLGLDPSTVSRHLKRAREAGIVRVEILRPRQIVTELGRKLSSRFGLRRALVVGTADEDSAQSLEQAAADFVGGLLRNGLHLGVSWGLTLAGVVQRLQPGTVSNLRVAQLSGGLSTTAAGIQGHELVRQVVSLYPGSESYYLHAPMIVDSAAIRDAMIGDRSIQASLVAAAASELALVGIGGLGPEATVLRYGHLRAEDLARVLGRGAAGSLNARFFDADGNLVTELDDRTLGITWEQLRRIPTVVAVAAGLPKVRAIRGAMRTGCIDVLITDQPTAVRVLEVDAAHP